MGRASDGEGCVEDVPGVDPSRIGFFPRGGAGDAERETTILNYSDEAIDEERGTMTRVRVDRDDSNRSSRVLDALDGGSDHALLEARTTARGAYVSRRFSLRVGCPSSRPRRSTASTTVTNFFLFAPTLNLTSPSRRAYRVKSFPVPTPSPAWNCARRETKRGKTRVVSLSSRMRRGAFAIDHRSMRRREYRPSARFDHSSRRVDAAPAFAENPELGRVAHLLSRASLDSRVAPCSRADER